MCTGGDIFTCVHTSRNYHPDQHTGFPAPQKEDPSQTASPLRDPRSNYSSDYWHFLKEKSPTIHSPPWKTVCEPRDHQRVLLTVVPPRAVRGRGLERHVFIFFVASLDFPNTL